MTERLVLIGTMGAGKTTVGRALANRLGWAYVDNDDELRRLTGMGPRDVVEVWGEPALRAAEREALRRSLAMPLPVVVSVAGGTAAEPQARPLLLRETVIWLRATPETLARRVAGSRRPWLGKDAAAAVTALDAARRPAYESIADHVVDVDGRTVEEVVDTLLRTVPIPVAEHP